MFKILSFGNASADYSTKVYGIAHSRAELASAFFYTTPGAKMLWQFGEFGYPIPIDENGRTGNKPILWDLLERDANKRLFNVTASLIKLRRDYPTFIDGESNLQEGLATGFDKSLTIRHPDMDVVVVGNFDTKPITVDATFPRPGTYYDYFRGGEFAAAGTGGGDVTLPVELKPGEYKLYTSKQLPPPQGGFLGDAVNVSERLPAGASVSIIGNPGRENFSVAITGWDGALDLSVHSAEGRKLLSQKLAGAGKHAIATAELATGTYLVSVVDASGRSWSALWTKL